ncbi:alpha/beta hydrolase [Pseudomonas sp.]|uniref:alpha/beta hydrolase n=1 Tax=Pseudomonas sp. TaxID=306 RepID=UPI002CE8B03D|nr:alpha/beta hydrolase [Pseudomonas sp.]HUE92618.1 alpha/beta hydrolase [Pseudomonas sp.]
MEAQKVILPSGKEATLAASPTLTPSENQAPKVVEVSNCRVVVFFIGGAGDKESYYMVGPYNNIEDAYKSFAGRIRQAGRSQFYQAHYLGYSEVRGGWDIDKYVYKGIPDKSAPVYIVGHSLGGWNGAHLSKILSEKGYKVEMLITLDPVGEGALVWLGSDVYFSRPEPVSGYWINVRAAPNRLDSSDSVANFGEQWRVDSGPDVNAQMDVNHARALDMFINPVRDSASASDILFESINTYIDGGCRV